jgi:hypothetical protein
MSDRTSASKPKTKGGTMKKEATAQQLIKVLARAVDAPASPECNLVFAIIAQAVSDALAKKGPVEEARRWLMHEEGFCQVAHLIGINPTWARELLHDHAFRHLDRSPAARRREAAALIAAASS